MSTAHTPGPWAWVEGERLAHDAPGWVIWSVAPAIVADCGDPVVEDAEGIAPANARLIAAAPDLLSPARVLASIPLGEEVIEDRDLILYRNAGCMITVGDVLEARAAVQKATTASAVGIAAGDEPKSVSGEGGR